MAKNKLLEFARENRHNATLAENTLWEEIRGRKLSGWKFRRQHPLPGGMIADFFCIEAGLIIEVDGSIDLIDEVKERDNARDNWSAELNIKVIRFTNEEILNNINNVKERILEKLASY